MNINEQGEKEMKKCFSVLVCFIILLVCGCSNNKNQVVIYSSMEENRNYELIKQLKEEFPSINVKVQSISTGNSAAKIKNEGSQVEADIVIDLETAHMENLQDNFADISFIDDSIYIDDINYSDKFITWVKNTMSLIIDKDYFDSHNLSIPETYDDLLKSEYKNLIAMPDPKTSGTGYGFFLNVINIKGENEAVKYFKKLKENLREFSASGSGPTNLLKQGEVAIALGMTSQGVSAINEGYNFEIIQLQTGSPYNTTSAGIIKGKENKENVVEVFEWLINSFGVYDKENFMPDVILKEQNIKVENYPTNLKDADMTGVNDAKLKEKYMDLWSQING